MRELSVTEQRYKAVQSVIADGRTVTEVAMDRASIGKRCTGGRSRCLAARSAPPTTGEGNLLGVEHLDHVRPGRPTTRNERCRHRHDDSEDRNCDELERTENEVHRRRGVVSRRDAD